MGTVSELCANFWAWRLEESPELATFCGIHESDDKLDDFSLEGFRRRKEKAEAFMKQCENNASLANLSEDEKLNVKLLQEDLRTYIEGCKYKGYLFTISYAEGIHVDFEQLTSWMKFNTVDDYRKYVARLGALPKRVRDVEELLREGVKLGLTNNEHSMKGVVESLASLEKKSSDTYFMDPFKQVSEAVDKGEIKDLENEAKSVIETKVQPAFKQLKEYIQSEYMKHLRAAVGVSSLPNGPAFYQECLTWHTSVNMTPQQVHQLGITEVKRIRTEMEKIISQLNFKGSFKEFLEYLRSDKQFYFDSKETLMNGFRDICDNQIRPLLPKLFNKIPEAKLVIEAVPESRPNAPAGYYLNGTLDGSRPGKYYVNINNLGLCPKYEMMTLSLHEGEPGHHFQGMYAIQARGVPSFRQYIEDFNYYAAPSRFPLHTAYLEGWGLYSEYLGEELGLYEDPYSMFGHLSFEMHRACRLVADTGIHALGWSYEQAVALFLDNTALAEGFVHSEVRRYITWPGQACAYKIGQLKIQELRKKANEQLGDLFEVKDFHEEVLKSLPVPLTVLETLIDDYIRRKKQQ